MVQTQLQAHFTLLPGTTLLFHPLLRNPDTFYRAREWEELVEKYKRRQARFVGHLKYTVGILDPRGRWPGVYLDPDVLQVVFEGDPITYQISSHHLAAGFELAALLQDPSIVPPDLRVGDLNKDYWDHVTNPNFHALYNDPTKLSFKSDEEEFKFWAQDGISYRFSTNNPNAVLFDSDFVVNNVPRRLHDCFAQHRERVHAVAERVHNSRVREPA